jgi:predicted AAA+ superfamily ATPase
MGNGDGNFFGHLTQSLREMVGVLYPISTQTSLLNLSLPQGKIIIKLSLEKGKILCYLSFIGGKMKEVVKQLISDFIGQSIPLPYPRGVRFPELPPGLKKALILIGMRRTGKTWCMYQEMHRLLKLGFDKQQLVYLNFEDDRLSQFKESDWKDLLPAYIELYPDQAEKISFLFLDEIQVAPNWEKFVLRMIEHENIKIYLSGSSAKMLSKEIATHLRGRTLQREVFPMSFKETLVAKNIECELPITTNQRAILQNSLEHYLHAGGFPETILADPALRIELIQSYIENVVYRDIVERYAITNIIAVKQFIIHVLKNSASLLSINKIYQSFKSQGINVSKNALYEYARYFEDAYCLFFVPAFNFSLREQSTKLMKVYPIDPGVITAYSIKPAYEQASTFETTVFLHLRRQFKEIFYYQTPSGKEVDFLVQTPQGSYSLYQASYAIDDPKTWEREINALDEAMGILGLDESYLITYDRTETIRCASGLIHCTALLEWLIGLQ